MSGEGTTVYKKVPVRGNDSFQPTDDRLSERGLVQLFNAVFDPPIYSSARCLLTM